MRTCSRSFCSDRDSSARLRDAASFAVGAEAGIGATPRAALRAGRCGGPAFRVGLRGALIGFAAGPSAGFALDAAAAGRVGLVFGGLGRVRGFDATALAFGAFDAPPFGAVAGDVLTEAAIFDTGFTTGLADRVFLAGAFLVRVFLGRVFLATAFCTADFRATVFFAGTFFATAFLTAVFLAAAFLTEAFLTVAFLGAAFLATVLLATLFLATAFFATAFLAGLPVPVTLRFFDAARVLALPDVLDADVFFTVIIRSTLFSFPMRYHAPHRAICNPFSTNLQPHINSRR
ncbi:hypothetical protein [Methyloferula stellata]|uniref:hypothetical protein n=1 Tax=Methyloferula stellata TaxID=876270 RepID=UPI00037BD7C8